MEIEVFGTLAAVYEGGPMLITAEQNFLISQSLSKEGHWAVINFQKTESRSSWLRLQLWFISSVQFSCSVVSDSSRPHEPQHARPPCPSPAPGVHPNSCPSSRWCHPTISSSVAPFSSCPQSFLGIRVFSDELALCIRWPKYWSFSFNISPSNEHPGLISFRMD